MKNTETTSAIASSWPIRMPASPIAKATSSARRGSLSRPWPLANHVGVTRSPDRAWRIRGAPRMLPRPELKVAPQMPRMTKKPQRDFSARTLVLSSSSATGIFQAKNTASAR